MMMMKTGSETGQARQQRDNFQGKRKNSKIMGKREARSEQSKHAGKATRNIREREGWRRAQKTGQTRQEDDL